MVIVGSVLVGSLNAVEASGRFENTNEQFAIALTADWKEVDPKTAPYAKEVLDQAGNGKSFAYQLGSDTNFAALVFVQIDNGWRIPEHELARLQIDSLRRRFVTDRLEVDGMLDSSYDTNRHMLRISSSTEIPATGRVRLLKAVYFTDDGTFAVSCIAPSEHYKLVGATFAAAVDSFHIDPSLAYRPRPVSDRQASSVARTGRVKIRFGFIFVIASLVLFVVHRLSNRVMSDEV